MYCFIFRVRDRLICKMRLVGDCNYDLRRSHECERGTHECVRHKTQDSRVKSAVRSGMDNCSARFFVAGIESSRARS